MVTIQTTPMSSFATQISYISMLWELSKTYKNLESRPLQNRVGSVEGNRHFSRPHYMQVTHHKRNNNQGWVNKLSWTPGPSFEWITPTTHRDAPPHYYYRRTWICRTTSTTDFLSMSTICLVPVPCISSMCHICI